MRRDDSGELHRPSMCPSVILDRCTRFRARRWPAYQTGADRHAEQVVTAVRPTTPARTGSYDGGPRSALTRRGERAYICHTIQATRRWSSPKPPAGGTPQVDDSWIKTIDQEFFHACRPDVHGTDRMSAPMQGAASAEPLVGEKGPSVLLPHEASSAEEPLDAEVLRDLNLDQVIDAIAATMRTHEVRRYFSTSRS